MIVERAGVEDAAEILALQKLAYRSEAEIYDDFTIPPLTQTLEGMRADFENQVVLKASIDGRIVGSVRASEEHGTCFIGRLIVHPDFQNRGIGAQLMREVEDAFAGAKRFELFTGDRSERNLYFYRKHGYRVFESKELTGRVTLVYMEKRREA
jgi:ribosomal protein S18 acetylase RimI-like enzyme